MRDDWLSGLAARRRRGEIEGVTSICSAHPLVIEIALAQHSPALIEATCNQVNQEGGYTGMTPAGFRRFVEAIAERAGRDPAEVVLGGDHLGPNPWRHLDAGAAMQRAEVMVAAFAEAGFAKLHLDASMGCRGEAAPLPAALVAERAARLAAAAESAAATAGRPAPLYVIGTEVPTPGGAAHALDRLEVTHPEAALASVDGHRATFAEKGLDAAFARVIAIVVQPGVEFDQSAVAAYDPSRAAALATVLTREPQLVFEAHSTDYQPAKMLQVLVHDGFSILKVGPALTFALREALYGLDQIAGEIDPGWREHSLKTAMERLMLRQPAHWEDHHRGSADQRRVLRHYSYSDRIRYYWPHPDAQAAVERLLGRLGEAPIPEILIHQFLPASYAPVRDGQEEPSPESLLRHAIQRALAPYPSPVAEP